MLQSSRLLAVLPRSGRHMPWWLRIVAIPVVVVVVVAGVWVAGGVLTSDAGFARLLIAAWFAVAGSAAILAAWRWRGLALAVLPAYAVAAAVLGGYLLYASSADSVVDEDVVMADPKAGVRKLAHGEFSGIEHSTTGSATVLHLPDDSRVVTLTDFDTHPGPDLRVYLTPQPSDDVSGGVDLGALKGNRGDQQYEVPEGAPVGAVVIWCRAFSVGFGVAELS
jgi:hypothetical protein